MIEIFGSILNMSLSGSLAVMIVIAVRALLRKYPKKYSYWLWAIAAFKLLCPISLWSAYRTLTYRSVETPEETSGFSPAAVLDAAEESIKRLMIGSGTAKVLMVIWAIGVTVLLTMVIVKSAMLHIDLKDAHQVSGNIYHSSKVSSPFVFGIFRPRVYVPLDMAPDESYPLIKHEVTHIKRKDLLFKSVGIFALALHWFNPLVWLALRLFERDMEMSCDEDVIRAFEGIDRAEYCTSLVNYARMSNAPKYSVMPVSFGKQDVKMRVQNILKYENISGSATVAAILLFALAVTGCIFTPDYEKIEIEGTSTITEKAIVNKARITEPVTETEEAEPEETTVEEVPETEATVAVEEPETKETINKDIFKHPVFGGGSKKDPDEEDKKDEESEEKKDNNSSDADLENVLDDLSEDITSTEETAE